MHARHARQARNGRAPTASYQGQQRQPQQCAALCSAAVLNGQRGQQPVRGRQDVRLSPTLCYAVCFSDAYPQGNSRQGNGRHGGSLPIPQSGHDDGCLAREVQSTPTPPAGVAAFMSANSKTPYITSSMGFPSGNGVVRGRGEGSSWELPCFVDVERG